MPPIKVVVTGAAGRMGKEVLNALCRDPELEPVGAVEREVSEEYLSLPDGSGLVPFSSNLESIIIRSRPQVLVDFTVPDAALASARTAIKHGVAVVVGTTGLSQDNLAEIDRLSRAGGIGAVVAPNFALGAVVMISLAKKAAKFFDYAEIVEMHHEQKADAPSGTALLTAKEMVESRGKPFIEPNTSKETLKGTRGGQFGGVTIHSMRLPGMVANQEVVFGGLGQTLTLRHDTISRESFMPGVMLAIKEVINLKGLVFGLDTLLGI